MFGLLAPLWLAGLVAIALPVAIHLRRRRAGRPIRVGSTRHLTEAATARRVGLRLHDLALLALRCAIVTLLALLLAGPVWRERLAPRPTSWVLIDPELADGTPDPATAAVLDSLRGAGAEMRCLTLDLAPLRSQPPRCEAPRAPAWSVLRLADARLPTGSRIAVIAAPRAADLRGDRPQLRSTVTWHAPADTTRRWWIERADLLAGDTVHVLLGTSDGATTRFVAVRAADHKDGAAADSARDAHPPLRIVSSGGRRLAVLDGDTPDTATLVSRSPRDVIVAAAPERADARYVVAALRAAASELGAPLRVRRTGVDEPAGDVAALVWLSDDPAPGVTGDVRLVRRAEPIPPDSALSAAFPRRLAADLLGSDTPAELEPAGSPRDPRRVAVRQALPAAGGTAEPVSRSTTDLAVPAGLLLLFLFVGERWLVHRRAR